MFQTCEGSTNKQNNAYNIIVAQTHRQGQFLIDLTPIDSRRSLHGHTAHVASLPNDLSGFTRLEAEGRITYFLTYSSS